jgi:hypothetical protein
MKIPAAAILVAALTAAAPIQAGTPETQAFSDARLAAFAKGDIEALLAQYSEDAVIIAPDGIHDTPEARRAFITAVIGAMGRPDLKFEMLKAEAAGDLLHYVWKAETGTVDFGTGVETYLIRDGKAIYQTEFNQPMSK